jgi:tRNA(fMet)-specific endonuclease VapC
VIRFALDTNVVVALLKTSASPLAERIRSHSVEEIAVSSIVLFELYFGAFDSARPAANVSKLAAVRFQVLPFEQEDARHAGEIRAVLRQKGTPIGAFDVLIAGQTRARNLTLVTANLGEFHRVPGLQVEDWSGP